MLASRVHQEVITRIESFMAKNNRSRCRRCILRLKQTEVQDLGKERDQVQELETAEMNLLEEYIQDLDQTHQEMISAQCNHLEEME